MTSFTKQDHPFRPITSKVTRISLLPNNTPQKYYTIEGLIVATSQVRMFNCLHITDFSTIPLSSQNLDNDINQTFTRENTLKCVFHKEKFPRFSGELVRFKRENSTELEIPFHHQPNTFSFPNLYVCAKVTGRLIYNNKFTNFHIHNLEFINRDQISNGHLSTKIYLHEKKANQPPAPAPAPAPAQISDDDYIDSDIDFLLSSPARNANMSSMSCDTTIDEVPVLKKPRIARESKVLQLIPDNFSRIVQINDNGEFDYSPLVIKISTNGVVQFIQLDAKETRTLLTRGDAQVTGDIVAVLKNWKNVLDGLINSQLTDKMLLDKLDGIN